MDDVEGKVIGPIPSEDGQAAQTVVTYNLGADGWNKMPGIADEIHDIAEIDGGTVYITGPGGTFGRRLQGLRGHRLHAAACSRWLRRDRDAAAHLPQSHPAGWSR